MENRAHALAAGLFLLVLGVALALVAVWFNDDNSASLVPYVVSTSSDVSGLKSEAPVRYRGVEVGRVQSISLDPEHPGMVRVLIGVSAATPVTRTTYAQLGFLGVTGLTFVSLRDEKSSGERLATTEASPGEISMRPSLMDSGEALLGAVSDIAAKAGGLLNEDTQQRVRTLLANAELAAGRAARLAEIIEPAARELPSLVTDARAVMSRADGTLSTLKSTADRADGALADIRTTAARAGELAGHLDALTLKLDARLGAIDQVGATARAVQDETLPRISRLADTLGREVRVLDRLIQMLNEQPNSLVFGAAPPSPGPGEPGFHP